MSESAKDSILQNMLAVEERSSLPAGNESSKKMTSPKPSTPPKKRGRPRNSSKTSPKTVETNVVVSPVPETTDPLDENLEDEENAPIFKPNKGPQTLFLSAPEQEVLYGGAAGGGKSYALLADSIRYAMYPDYVGLILRRTNDELRELIQKSQLLYPKAYPGARWRQKQSEWQFPSGARLWFAFLDNDEDVMRYQGQAFAYIGFDELTQYPTPYPWDYLRSRLRTTNPEIPLQMRATSNPGGPGHAWVRKMFIAPSNPNKPFWARSLETGEILRFPKYMRDGSTLHPKSEVPLFQRKFIPASLYDNPYLTMDANYEANLMSLPEIDRKRLLDGDWDVISGAAFPEFNRKIHSVEPFHIPSGWTRFRACDYGYGSHSSVLWFAVHPSGQLIIYREMYVTGVTAEDLAEKIVDIETEYGDRISYGILDSSMWHKRGDTGPSMAEKMIRKGCKWRPSDRSKGSRISGKNEVHRVLKVDPFLEQPRLIIFNTCTNILSHLPTIPLDKRNPEDVDTHFVHDHSYDALRYGVMSRPKSRSTLGFDESRTHHNPYQPVDPTFGA